MLRFIGRAVLLVLLVAIIILGIVAIQYPAIWHKDWHKVQNFFAEQTAALPQVSSPTPTPKVVQPAPVPVVVTPPTPAPVVVPPAPKPVLNTRQLTLLMAARHAFWVKDYSVCIADYRALLAAKPDVPAIYGEFGNVLWHLGQGVSAANAYAHAARLLIRDGKYQQAASMIPMLTRLDPDAAERVQEMLAQ